MVTVLFISFFCQVQGTFPCRSLTGNTGVRVLELEKQIQVLEQGVSTSPVHLSTQCHYSLSIPYWKFLGPDFFKFWRFLGWGLFADFTSSTSLIKKSKIHSAPTFTMSCNISDSRCSDKGYSAWTSHLHTSSPHLDLLNRCIWGTSPWISILQPSPKVKLRA